jgi:hypothetical protein
MDLAAAVYNVSSSFNVEIPFTDYLFLFSINAFDVLCNVMDGFFTHHDNHELPALNTPWTLPDDDDIRGRVHPMFFHRRIALKP